VRKMPKMRRVLVTLTDELSRALRIRCATDDVRVTEFLRELLERELRADCVRSAKSAAKAKDRPHEATAA
jgi:plasmid stability protein